MLGLSRLFFESTENNSYIYYSLVSLGLEFSDDQDKFEYEYYIKSKYKNLIN